MYYSTVQFSLHILHTRFSHTKPYSQTHTILLDTLQCCDTHHTTLHPHRYQTYLSYTLFPHITTHSANHTLIPPPLSPTPTLRTHYTQSTPTPSHSPPHPIYTDPYTHPLNPPSLHPLIYTPPPPHLFH